MIPFLAETEPISVPNVGSLMFMQCLLVSEYTPSPDRETVRAMPQIDRSRLFG